MGDAGEWSGEFFDADDAGVPMVALGEFTATFNDVGRMEGAFGAHREE